MERTAEDGDVLIEISSTEDNYFQEESSASEVIVPKRKSYSETYYIDSDDFRESSESEVEIVQPKTKQTKKSRRSENSDDEVFGRSDSDSDAKVGKKPTKKSNKSSDSADDSNESDSQNDTYSADSDLHSASNSDESVKGKKSKKSAKSNKYEEYVLSSSESSSSSESYVKRKKPPAARGKGRPQKGSASKKAAAAPPPKPTQQNRVSIDECLRAEKERLFHLAKYRKLFEPFITSQVMARLTNSTRMAETGQVAVVVEEELTQPKALTNVQMRDYQVKGMSWLVNNYFRSINCILGDEMGLGKTLQSIAFVAHLVTVRKICGPFLFVVPLSVLFNWYNEFKRWCPSISVLRFYSGDKDEQARLKTVLMDSARNEVVLATYDTVKHGGLAGAFRKVIWRAVFLDEGHRVRHEDTLLSQTCRALQSQFRCILTGTPIQNNLHEMGALLQYIAPNIFTDLTLFDAGFDLGGGAHKAHKYKGSRTVPKRKKVVHSDEEDVDQFADSEDDAPSTQASKSFSAGETVINRELLEKAHYMLRPFLLRRVKSEVEQKLPPKLETKINCPMTPKQKEIMQKLLFKEKSLMEQLQAMEAEAAETAKKVVEGENNEGEASEELKKPISRRQKEAVDLVMSSGLTKSAVRLQGLYAQMRKASNHPFLFPGNETLTLDGSATEEIVTASGKMTVLDKLLKALYEKGHRVVLFSQFTKTLDILSDYLDMRGYRHTRLDGSTTRVMREVRINLFNKENSKLFVFLLTTRAGGEGVNLYTADTAILFDSDWNPQVDLQAMARVHRIGQKKIVHIYRLVTAGSVEERIVQRAQKKLFLDMMVNRVSTGEAKRMDEEAKKRKRSETSNADDEQGAAKVARTDDAGMEVEGDGAPSTTETASIVAPSLTSDPQLEARIEQLQAELQAEEAEDGGPGVSKVFAALKFGWNSVFSATGQGQKEITDADIEYIIDRSRGGLKLYDEASASSSSSSAEGTSSAGKDRAMPDAVEVINGHDLCLEDQQVTIEKFDENEPWVTVDQLRFKHLEDAAAADKDKTESSTTDGIKPLDNQAIAAAASLPAKDSANSFENLINAMGITRSKRVSQSRTVLMEVEELGLVEVLKSSIDDGQSLEVNKKAKADAQMLFAQGRLHQRAGRDYEHQNHCQVCRDGGSLIVCEYCPMAYHFQCLGMKRLPTENAWKCPHHKCVDCGRTASAAGLIFRCEMCELAYCEDCLPSGSDVLGESDILSSLGYIMNAQSCYIHCSQRCIELAKSEAVEFSQPHTEAGGDANEASGIKTRRIRELEESETRVHKDRSALENLAAGRSVDINSAIENCYLRDVEQRLLRDTMYAPARFKSLNEIPHFHRRLSTCEKVHTLVLLLKIVCAVEAQITGASGALAPQGDEITKKILEYKGVPVSWSYEQKALMFLTVVKILAQGQKEDLKRLATILGLAVAVPFKRHNSVDSEGKAKICYEPKFLMSREYHRPSLEEAIASFMVVPTPQNMLLPKDERTRPNDNDAPLHCILYSLRLLESLGEYLTDANKQYFVSMSLLDQRSLGLNAWLPVYPTKMPANAAQKRVWVDPVCRMYAKGSKKGEDYIGLYSDEVQLLTSRLPPKEKSLTVPDKKKPQPAFGSDDSEADASDEESSDFIMSNDDDEDDGEDDDSDYEKEIPGEGAKDASQPADKIKGKKAVPPPSSVTRAPLPFGSITGVAPPLSKSSETRMRLYELAMSVKKEMQQSNQEKMEAFQKSLEEERRLLMEETAEKCKAAVAQALINDFKPTNVKPTKPGQANWQRNLNKMFRRPVLDAVDFILKINKSWFGDLSLTDHNEFAKDLELALLMNASNTETYCDLTTLCSRLLALVKAGNKIKPEVYKSFYVDNDPEEENESVPFVMPVVATSSSEVVRETQDPVEAYLEYMYTKASFAKPVEQLHLTEDRVLRVYPSLVCAQSFLGLSDVLIHCLKGKCPSAGGYRWRYGSVDEFVLCRAKYQAMGWSSFEELRTEVLKNKGDSSSFDWTAERARLKAIMSPSVL